MKIFMILILTDRNDVHADILIQKLKKGLYFRLNLDIESLESTKVSFIEKEWILLVNNEKINLKLISLKDLPIHQVQFSLVLF